jgi:hypothetical protein
VDGQTEEAPAKTRGAAFKDLTRFVLNIQPYVFRFPMLHELATQSYHLRFTGARDHYVTHTRVIRKGGDANKKSHLVISRSSNRNTIHYAHIYVRPLTDTRPSGKLITRIAVAERPPGMLGLAALVNLLQLATVLFALFFYRELFGPRSGDVALLVLAFPGLASAWLANQIVPGRLQRMPLAAVLGIAWAGAAALLSLGLAILAKAGTDPWEFDLSGQRVHTAWALLLILSVGFTGNAIGRWWHRAISYVHRRKRAPRLDRYTV